MTRRLENDTLAIRPEREAFPVPPAFAQHVLNLLIDERGSSVGSRHGITTLTTLVRSRSHGYRNPERSGKDHIVIDVDLIDALLIRRVNAHLGHNPAKWCCQNAVTETALRAIAESGHCGTNPDTKAASKNAFQVAVELRQLPELPGAIRRIKQLPDLAALEDAAADRSDKLVRVTEADVRRILRTRDWLLSDEDWSARFHTTAAALERIAVTTYGRYPDPAVAARSSFEVGIEADRLHFAARPTPSPRRS